MTKFQSGFTLAEAVIVIAITGIIGAVVAVFIKAPVQGYFDASRRAEMTDVADTALRRISRDLRLAVPNSVRIPSALCFEFLPTSTGGRYRAEAPGNFLEFTSGTTTTFDVLGSLIPVPTANDQVVVYNLGIAGANAYSGDNRAAVANGSTASSVNLAAAFPSATLASPGNRFHIVPDAEQAVFYVCSNPGIDAAGNGTGILYRYSRYGINPATPAACPVLPAGTPIFAQNVSNCVFQYQAGITERSGLVSMQLSVARGGEKITLYHQVHVSNAP